MSGEGSYRLIRKVADGGMAEIFLAELLGARGFRRTVVLKRVRTALFADPQFRNMLLDEAHIAMGLNHGNIVSVLGLGEADGRYFLAMELVDGWSLDELLRRAHRVDLKFPRPLALYVVAQTCRALAYAHAFARDGEPLQIVHRDVSPQNILVSEQGEVKLADFGIARAQSRSEKTAPGVVKGKVRFMSPEQVQAGALDRRSDLFSLGTVLYQVIVGQQPFTGPTDLEVLAKIAAAKFPPAEEALPGLEPGIARIIARALQRRPEDRYADADEMLADVEKALRADFPPTGQSELKAWLASLAALDGALPISKVPVSEVDRAEVTQDGPIELHDSDILPASQPPAPAPRPSAPFPVSPLPRAAPPERGKGLWLALLLAVAAVAAWRLGLAERAIAAIFPPPPPPLSGPGPTLAELLPPKPQESAPGDWADFPGERAPEAALDAGAASLVAEAAADAGDAESKDGGADEAVAEADDGGTGADDATEAQLARAVVPEAAAAVIDEDEGEPEPPPAGADAGSAGARPGIDAGRAAAAPAPQVAAAPTVMVKIATVPPEAYVRLNRRVFGRTPISLRFRSGIIFELELIKSGYLPAKKRFLVTGKPNQEVWVPLKKAPAKRKR